MHVHVCVCRCRKRTRPTLLIAFHNKALPSVVLLHSRHKSLLPPLRVCACACANIHVRVVCACVSERVQLHTISFFQIIRNLLFALLGFLFCLLRCFQHLFRCEPQFKQLLKHFVIHLGVRLLEDSIRVRVVGDEWLLGQI